MEINDFGGEGGKGFNVKQGLVMGERNLVGGGTCVSPQIRAVSSHHIRFNALRYS